MFGFKDKRIFLDYASATPVLPEVKRAMETYWSEHFHNPSAIYKEGLAVKKVVEKNRARIARLLGVQPEGIIFTSSGTESNNLAVLGTYSKSLETFKRPHMIVSAIEHPSILAAAEEVGRRGGEVSILEVDEDGVVNLKQLEKLLKRTTVLVSVGLANHEIGTLEPVAKVGRLLRKYRRAHASTYPYLHTDASAAANVSNLSLESLQADLLTLDGAKMYGPKGVGILATRGTVELKPVMFGGDQEGGKRAGTLSPALISGMTIALEKAMELREQEAVRLESLRKYFIDTVSKKLPQAIWNGSLKEHVPNLVSVSIPNTLAEFVVIKLDLAGVAASVGSACSLDGRTSGSPVMRAIGKPDLAESTIRFSFGRYTTMREVERAAEIFCKISKSVIK